VEEPRASTFHRQFPPVPLFILDCASSYPLNQLLGRALASTLGKPMKLSEFDYALPKALIAQHPLAERDASRLLLLDRASHGWEDRRFRELPELLRGDELLVVNNARVIPARLIGRRAGVRARNAPAVRAECGASS